MTTVQQAVSTNLSVASLFRFQGLAQSRHIAEFKKKNFFKDQVVVTKIPLSHFLE
jgi:hypothetical protein